MPLKSPADKVRSGKQNIGPPFPVGGPFSLSVSAKACGAASVPKSNPDPQKELRPSFCPIPAINA